MNAEITPHPTSSAASDINRLHQEVVRLTAESSQALQAAVVTAWRAGQILIEEKQRVRRTMGGGAWLTWLEQNFQGTPRTAQRYMLLARGIADTSYAEGMSLRMLYARLGVATEPKSSARTTLPRVLPPHLALANKLLCALRSERKPGRLTEERLTNYRRDLRPLYDQLRPIFEPHPAPALRASEARAVWAAGD